MPRQVLTAILDRTALEGELEEVVRYFTEKRVYSCRVLFGSAWGNEYYPGPKWNDEEIELSQLRRKVNEVEGTGIGTIGGDDLFVKIENVEFQFCHECDVHIHFEEQNNSHVEAFFARWQTLGYSPAEWVETGRPGPGQKAR